ncbi:MAG: hypothetical protein A2X94_08540 [Bdellovibrionales bacterium GWB1_55_8]|nr:MAG: hypothetical protein A2X94_08540 [Bdellovibrionales bacterium GWB1_55_8]
MSKREDFEAFLTAEQLNPPPVLTDAILSRVHADLNPTALSVFTKVAGIHAIVGILSLVFVCPQFGVSPLGHTAIMEWFMQFGHEVCMIACGAVFLGGSALAMSLVLRREEVRVIRRTKLMQLGVLGLLSIGAFLCAGAGVVASLAMFWLLGSFVGGMASLEIGWVLRQRLSR